MKISEIETIDIYGDKYLIAHSNKHIEKLKLTDSMRHYIDTLIMNSVLSLDQINFKVV